MVFSRLLKGSASVLLLVCLGVAAACDGTSGDTAATGSSGSGFACVPGQTISCACPGAAPDGVQSCKADGSGYDLCLCESTTASTTVVSSSAGTGGSGGAGGAMSSSSSGDPCAGHVTYANKLDGVGPVWAQAVFANGKTGLAAGNEGCLASGADHVCDYEEVLVAEKAGELATIPAGTTAWVHRTTVAMVNGVPSNPGPGGTCNNWTYSTNHIGDGEYLTFDAVGVPTYHLDNDTIYDGVDNSHTNPADLQCGGTMRSILCCFQACEPPP